ncbi:hypothetical protein M569_13491, partial [Genlisea aurea]
MPRRATEFRRPVRRTFSCWICVLALFLIAGLALFVVQHYHDRGHNMERVIRKSNFPRSDRISHDKRNLTEELLSSRSYARQLVEQMTLAKAYVVLAKEHNNLLLAWELSSQIRTCQLLLSKATKRDHPLSLDEAEPVIRSLSSLIYKAQDAHYDVATTIVTMKSHIQALQDRVSAAILQGALFGQLVAESVPKNIQCLEMRLMAQWLSDQSLQEEADRIRSSPRLVDNNLYHFCIFSDNLLAVSVVVNSTVSNAEHPKQLVFHVVTNEVKYGAMQAWFISNDFQGATIEVMSVEELSWLNASYSPVVKRLHQSSGTRKYSFEDGGSEAETTEYYVSLLNHLRFYVPEIYPELEKVVFLEEDVVVQKDLRALFSLDLHGNVNGAVETCLDSFHRLYKYLNFSNPSISSKFDPQACGWAFGLNVFDLMAWRRENVTGRYHFWEEENADGSIWKAGTTVAPAGLLAFYGSTEALDRRWHVLGLGYDADIDKQMIESGAVVHFNGNLKPWLRVSIGRYRHLWEQHLNQT